MKEDINIFTDGGCLSNGKKDSRGGIGVYFGKDDPRNISKSIKEAYDEVFTKEKYTSKDTNNKAELLAILCALLSVKENLLKGNKVNLFSDSQYSINSLTIWRISWEKNDWKNSKNKLISNDKIIKKIVMDFIKPYGNLISFVKVKAHSKPGEQSEFIKSGNDAADLLSRLNIN